MGGVNTELLPEDVAKFLENMTTYREEVNAGTPQEWGEFVRSDAERAAYLCDKYGVRYVKGYEEPPEGERRTRPFREVYNDGSKAEWE